MKNKNTAGLLALLLGGVGAHKFYLGQPMWGLAYLVFCWTLIPALVALVEALNLFFMSEATFQKRHGGAGVVVMGPGGPTLATPETHVKCPDCRELVLRDARKCRHCGTALIPQ